MSPLPLRFRVLALGIASPSLFAPAAGASERRFAFTYETPVLPAGDIEVEPWTTLRLGREHYYSRIEQRLEIELGLSDRLQTAWYWNFSSTSEDVLDEVTGEPVRASSVGLASVSSEWKYALSDPLADSLGSALYLEGSLGPEEGEVEAKILLDKQVGNLIVAANLVGEQEWIFDIDETRELQVLELNLAAGYFFTPSLVAGLETLETTRIEDGELTSSALYAGPSVAYAAENYWLALAALPQVFAPKAASGDALDLEHGEHLRVRLLLGFHP